MNQKQRRRASGEIDGLRWVLEESKLSGVNLSDLRQRITERIATIDTQLKQKDLPTQFEEGD